MQNEMFKLVIGVLFTISIIITVIGLLLFISVFKRKKYSNMTVEESPLLKYLKIITVGMILSYIIEFIIIITR
jgi:hypothetical protein